MDGWMHERMHARRMDVDAHFGHPDISFPKDKCRIEDIGPQNGSKHAFKWDLNAKVDDPMGKLLFGFDWAAGIWLKCFVCYTSLSEQRGQRVGFGTR